MKNFFKAVWARNKVERRRILSDLNIGETWRQKAYHAIPLSGLSAISQTQLGAEERNQWLYDVSVGGNSDFALFRGVCPSWDNEARKPGRGATYHNSSPALYQKRLAESCRFAANESIGIVYCQSYLVDPENRILGDAIQWTDDLDPCRWRSDFVNDGKAEVKSYLSKKNTIPNASAVLVKASTLKSIDYLDDTYGLCGDWLLWIKLLLRCKVAYVVEKLNYWRQHSSNSRSYPPGILEWQEGQRILGYLAHKLGLSESEREKIFLDFRARCSEWMNNSRSLGSD